MQINPGRILVGVDLSECAGAALRLAGALAAKSGAREQFSDWTVLGSTAEKITRHATCAVLTVTS